MFVGVVASRTIHPIVTMPRGSLCCSPPAGLKNEAGRGCIGITKWMRMETVEMKFADLCRGVDGCIMLRGAGRYVLPQRLCGFEVVLFLCRVVFERSGMGYVGDVLGRTGNSA